MSCATSGQDSIEIVRGVPEQHRATAASLYDAAFGEKFKLAIPDKASRLKLFEGVFHLEHCIAAMSQDALVGIAGFTSDKSALTAGITYDSLKKYLGTFGALRAGLVLSFYERKKSSGELLMDGISVGPEHRGKGIGTQLLSELALYASEHNYKTIRLDVIDTNKAAMRMYERNNFVAGKTEHFEFLRGVLGFGATTTMIRTVN